MGRSLVVAVLGLLGLLCAAGMGYAAYVVSRGSVAVPVTRLQPQPQQLTPAQVRAKPSRAATGRATTTRATTTRATTSGRTTTVADHGGRPGRGGDDDNSGHGGGGGHGGDD
jgi:hypothetical protein